MVKYGNYLVNTIETKTVKCIFIRVDAHIVHDEWMNPNDVQG